MREYCFEKENMNRYLVIYDITDDHRRRKLSKLLEAYGIRVQESAFELKLNKSKLKWIRRKIPTIISGDDDVRLYKITQEVSVCSKVSKDSVLDINLVVV